ncbi:MAG TPA: MBL fold metallo-hydrolase [Chloroflexota bacterium]|nr:MBL fold metallo-hydrolase [Chloroflexota bacterium]
MKIGKIELEILNDGHWHTDGGAMFGVVPRPLWEKRQPPDDRNRVRLALRCLLIRVDDRTILVDTGIGDKLGPKESEIFSVERDTGLIGALASYGITPDSVEVVVNTHLHFDHAGGNTTRHLGALVPTFSNAEYWVQRLEWDDATHANERTRTTYLSENFEPVERSGQLRLFDGATEIAPGVHWLMAAGHTRAHTCVLIESEDQSALFAVDVCPFVAHLERIAWVPAVDVEPLVSMETKRRIVADLLAHDRLVIFDHDPNVVTARLSGTPEKWTVEPEILTIAGAASSC